MTADPRLLEFARRMRREPTPCEAILWRELRNRQLAGFKFRRQHPVGRYVADFYSASASLVVELDGDSHVDPDAVTYDAVRTDFFESLGIEVRRLWNVEIYDNLEGILELIYVRCVERTGSQRR